MEQADKPGKPRLEIIASRQFTSWLDEQKLSLAFTTYQSGKLFLIGIKENGRLSVFERTSTAPWDCAATLRRST